MRTRIKFCGLTTENNVLQAIEAGADALGFVFYEPSPRFVSVEKAAELMQKIPAFVSTVALVVNPDDALMKQLSYLPIDCIQFHGAEEPESCKKLAHIAGVKRWFKALQVKAGVQLHAQAQAFIKSGSSAILLDGYDPSKPSVTGGTGKAFDWSIIEEFASQVSVPVILAGGLTVYNVEQAIHQSHPFAVDVSGGIEMHNDHGEKIKGLKDEQKMKQFMHNVHKANVHNFTHLA